MPINFPGDQLLIYESPRLKSDEVIDRIGNLQWEGIDQHDLLAIANAYYFFSVQFRENLQVAHRLFPDDWKLRALYEAECDTDNLSPWPGVAAAGEKLDHDEFVRRLLSLQPLDCAAGLRQAGAAYLAAVRRVEASARAKSIASYEDGGLTTVFLAMLRAPCWEGGALQAFRFFLQQHIMFDTANDGGHGSLSRHLLPDDSILPLWLAFEDILLIAAPRLAAERRPHE